MSDWKRNAAARRDARDVKLPNDETKPGASRKNTKRWCRGKVGTEHAPKCYAYSVSLSGNAWKTLDCERCGRRLDYWFPMLNERRPKPAWVID